MTPASFHDPLWFGLFGLFPILFYLHVKQWRPRFPTFTVARLSDPASGASQQWSPPDVLFAVRLLTLASVILGLANLKTVETLTHRVPAQGVDIVLALDVSGSMLIEDIKPNRLEALKSVIARFVAGRSEDRLGLVLYAGESINACPLTRDYGYLLRQLNVLEQVALADGTAIGLGLASAVNALRHSKSTSKIIVLLTDGENNAGYIEPTTAAALARKYHIKVYTIGVGAAGKAPMPVYDLEGRKTYHYVSADLDEPSLRSIASQTGGKYYRAQDAASLQQIYAEINGLEKSPTGHRTEYKYTARYRWFLWAGLLFLILEVGIKLVFLRTLV